jgi:hypothetical protein
MMAAGRPVWGDLVNRWSLMYGGRVILGIVCWCVLFTASNRVTRYVAKGDMTVLLDLDDNEDIALG